MSDAQPDQSLTIFQRLRAQGGIKSVKLSLHQLHLGTPYLGYPEHEHVLVVKLLPLEEWVEVPLDPPLHRELSGHFDFRVDLNPDTGNVIHKSGMWLGLSEGDILSFVLDIRFTGHFSTEHPFTAWNFTVKPTQVRFELSEKASTYTRLSPEFLQSLKAVRLLNYTLRTTWVDGLETTNEDIVINHG
jgi:hypothetical protein